MIAVAALLLCLPARADALPAAGGLFQRAPTAHAARIHPRPILGIGDQQPDMFTNKRWKQLGVRDARYIAPWDVVYDPWQSSLLDAWLRAAGHAHVRAVIGFVHSFRSERLAHTLPTWRQFQRAFRLLRKRYPFIRNYIAWNEANSPGSLTATKPWRAAQYFDVVARNCRGCAVVAADVLDTKTVVGWVKSFRRAAHVRPRLWGLHNYSGANHLSTRGTMRLLANTRGPVWFTETGGVVLRREMRGRRVLRTFRYGVRHATLSTRYALELSCLSRRISRVYLYEWQPPRHPTSWDSGLLDPRGRPRPAYYAVRKWRRISLRTKPARARTQLCHGGF